MQRPLAIALLAAAALMASNGLASAPRPSQATAGAQNEFPAEWFWDTRGAQAHFAPMRGKEPPPLTVRDWIGTPQTLEALKGKVVLVDFWATWCPPCMRSLPEMNALAKEFEKDLVVIGVHDAKRGVDTFAKTVADKGIMYPMCVDDGGRSASDWGVKFWPTVAIIDRAGKLRAIGLIPDRARAVIQQLLKEEPPAPAAPAKGAAPAKAAAPAKEATEKPAAEPPQSAVFDSFVEGGPERARTLRPIMQRPLPELTSPEWVNSAPLTFEGLKGKVVVLDFWATWCGPCIQTIPHNNAIFDEFGDKIALIGVCHPRGGERMAAVAAEKGIRYPICRLLDDALIRAFQVNGFPDYVLIDAEGVVRVPDCANGKVEMAIEMLLSEASKEGQREGKKEGAQDGKKEGG